MSLRATLALIAVLCTNMNFATAESPEKAAVREGRLQSPRELSSTDQWFKARVPAKVGEVRRSGDSYLVTLDIGAKKPVVCEVVPNGLDMADTLRRNFDTSMEQVGISEGRVQLLNLEATDAGAIGNAPFLATRWRYGTNDGSKSLRLGALKQFVFTRLGHGVYCSHIDMGFVQTFETVTHALAASFEAPAAGVVPYFVEIKTASASGSGMKLGVTVSTLQRDAMGGTVARQINAMLIAGSGEMHSHDAVHLVQLRPDDSLVNAAHIILRDGKPAMKIELSLNGDRWVVGGEHEGRRVSATLPAGAQPGNWVEQARALRKILSAENPVGVEHTLALWTPSQPTVLLDMRTRVLERKSANEFAAQVQISQPRWENDLVLDRATGLPSSAEIPRGQQFIHMERVYISGSF